MLKLMRLRLSLQLKYSCHWFKLISAFVTVKQQIRLCISEALNDDSLMMLYVNQIKSRDMSFHLATLINWHRSVQCRMNAFHIYSISELSKHDGQKLQLYLSWICCWRSVLCNLHHSHFYAFVLFWVCRALSTQLTTVDFTFLILFV